jgi:hypothetical protein
MRCNRDLVLFINLEDMVRRGNVHTLISEVDDVVQPVNRNRVGGPRGCDPEALS